MKLVMGKRTSRKVLTQLCEDSLSSALGCALSFLEKVSFDKKDGQQVAAICLFARITELAASCKALLEKQALVGLPILLRSMFEADVDLTNCINDTSYFKAMYAAFLKERIRLTKEALPDKDNPYLSPISQFRDFGNELQVTQVELEQLESEGCCSLNIRERSDKAGKLNEYLSLYNMLCLDTHNNIGSLENYHIISGENQSDYHVVVFNVKKEDLLACISAIPGILFHRTRDLMEFFGLDDFKIVNCFENFKKLQQSLEEHAQSELSNKRLK
jgi:hypothetical protein